MNFEETFVFKLDVQKQLLDMGLKPSTTGLYKAGGSHGLTSWSNHSIWVALHRICHVEACRLVSHTSHLTTTNQIR
jgi:hypothetical protein